MDYKLFRNILAPYLVDQMSAIQEVKKYVGSIAVEDAFDKKFLTILNNIIGCLETNEAIKNLARHLLDEADFFSDTAIHKATKSKYLDKLLSDSDYIEQTKSFSLSVIQTYVEKIIHKQLYEINIKIEENQRSLNKLEVASGKMREEVQNQGQIQQTNIAQQQAATTNSSSMTPASAQQSLQRHKSLQSQQIRKPQQSRQIETNGAPSPKQTVASSESKQIQATQSQPQQLQSISQQAQHAQSLSQQTQASQPQIQSISPQTQSSQQTESRSQPQQKQELRQVQSQPVQTPPPQKVFQQQETKLQTRSHFLLVEIDQQQCAVIYKDIVEIIKFDKPVSEKILKSSVIPHNKLVGFARGGSVLKKVNDFQMDNKQSLNNINIALPNQDDKRFAVIINRADDYDILFVDYIVYAEPVDGQEMGDYVKTVEGEYKIMNIKS
ncbi:MAG: hypothetical protein HQK67_01825 [Desulfamplus sp.]|nr:hypothetical protein [Desulfamplus sp.]